MGRAEKFSVNDQVRFSRNFLRSTGQITGDKPFAKGKVIDVSPVYGLVSLVTVDWGTHTGNVLNTNLQFVGKLYTDD